MLTPKGLNLTIIKQCLLFTFSKPLWYKIGRWHGKESRIASFCSNCLCQVRLSSARRLHRNSACAFTCQCPVCAFTL